jgi:hypothetical protein
VLVGAGTFAATALAGTAAPIAAPLAGGILGGMAASYVAPELYGRAKDALQIYMYSRPMDEAAAHWGGLVGSTGGSLIGSLYGAKHGAIAAIRWLYPTYRSYEVVGRRLTEETFRRNRHAFDPHGLRGPLCHLDHKFDHKFALRWGYEHGILPGVLAEPWNLQMLPGPENIRKGTKLPTVPVTACPLILAPAL